MKRKTLGFMNIKHDVLSREEMRSIMAGSGECALYCDGCTIRCGVTPCNVVGDHMHCDGKTYTCDNPHC